MARHPRASPSYLGADLRNTQATARTFYEEKLHQAFQTTKSLQYITGGWARGTLRVYGTMGCLVQPLGESLAGMSRGALQVAVKTCV